MTVPLLRVSLCPTNQRFYDSRTFSFNLGRARGEHVPHASPLFRYLGLHLAASRSDGRAVRLPMAAAAAAAHKGDRERRKCPFSGGFMTGFTAAFPTHLKALKVTTTAEEEARAAL